MSEVEARPIENRRHLASVNDDFGSVRPSKKNKRIKMSHNNSVMVGGNDILSRQDSVSSITFSLIM